MIELMDYRLIANRLRLIRNDKSVEDFARYCEVSRADVLRWEKPVSKMRLNYLARVSHAYSVSLKWIMFGHTYGGLYFNPEEYKVQETERESALAN